MNWKRRMTRTATLTTMSGNPVALSDCHNIDFDPGLVHNALSAWHKEWQPVRLPFSASVSAVHQTLL